MDRTPPLSNLRARAFRSSAFAGAFFTLLSMSTGCAKKGAEHDTKLPIRPGMTQEEIEDLAFADDFRGLFTAKPGSDDRRALLARVARTQFRRCERRFEQHLFDRGLLCVEGSLYLFRTGEMTREANLAARSALAMAAREFARRGDTGRAQAAYGLLHETATGEEKKDLEGHLSAIDAWSKVGAEGSLRRAGAQHQAAKARRLLEPSQAAFDDARTKTTEWMRRAVQLMGTLRVPNAPSPSREELAEAYRALDSASRALVLHYLRDADAKGAKVALESPLFRDHTSRPLRASVEGAAEDPSTETWLALLRHLSSPPKEGEEVEFDRRDIAASAFAIAWEAYRLDPSNPEAAGTVASVLSSFGMDEAIPAIIGEAAREHAGPKALSSALALVMRAMQDELDVSDVASARRTYTAALPILALAELSPKLPEIAPSPWRVKALMGQIEMREGNLDTAISLLEPSLQKEPTAGGFFALARIYQHRNDPKKALALLDRASKVLQPDERLISSEMAKLRAELVRPSDEREARRILTEAVMGLDAAKKGAPRTHIAAIERSEAYLLDRLGEDALVDQALERALDAANRDKREAADVFSFLVWRSLVAGKLDDARAAFRRAAGWGLEDEDLVYLALWVRHLERMQERTGKVSPAETSVQRVLSMPLDTRWVSVLAAFGAGRISEGDLQKRAKSYNERAEAQFYIALDARARGQAFEHLLKKTLEGTGVDLTETVIARDLLDPGRRLRKGAGIRLD